MAFAATVDAQGGPQCKSSSIASGTTRELAASGSVLPLSALTVLIRAASGVALLWLLACCSERTPALANQGAIDGPDGLAGMPATVRWEDTSPGWSQANPKLLLTGTIYKPDAKTPAAGVVLYYYHTNAEGRYLHKPEEPRSMPPNELGQTHGYLRGWVRTGEDGRYAIKTVRPGIYPTRDEPAHVHATIKEPGAAEYYIDDFVFDDDPILTTQRRLRMENRCGSGVLRLVKKDGVLIGERDIILGQNIPGHPGAVGGGVPSGRKIGEDVVSFTPFHAWGPDKGTRACPICKYGWYHGILYFVGNNPNWADIKAWLRFLEAESARRANRLQVYFVYGSDAAYTKAGRERELERLGRELNLKRVALTFVPAFTDSESDVVLNRINPAVGSTFILYRRSRIIDKSVDLKPNEGNFKWIRERLDQTANEYFDLPK